MKVVLQSIADPLMLASLFQVGGTSSGTVGLLHGPAVAPVPSLNPDSMFEVVSSILSSTSSSFDPQRYLVECFNRLPSLSSTVDAAAVPGSVAVEGEGEAEALASAVAHARATLQEASRCIVSFSVTVMMEPDVFPRAGSEKCAGLMQLMSSLDPGSSALVSADYMAAIGEELATTGQLPVFADCVCRFLLTKLFTMDVMTPLYPVATPALLLVSSKRIAVAIAESAVFLPPFLDPTRVSGAQVESMTLLGLCARLSAMTPKVAALFSDRSKLTQQAANAHYALIRRHLSDVQAFLFEFLRKLCAASPIARERVFQFLGVAVFSNAGRTKSHTGAERLASDGFFVNLGCALASLCEPFMAPSSDKVGSLDPSFLLTQGPSMTVPGGATPLLVSTAEEVAAARSRLISAYRAAAGVAAGGGGEGGVAVDRGSVASAAGAAGLVGGVGESGGAGSGAGDETPPQETDFKFPTRVFFYAARTHQLGLAQISSEYKMALRTLGHIQSRMDGNPAYEMEFNRRVAVKLGNDATLLSPSVTSLGLRLSVLQLEWCRRVCAGNLTPTTSTGASASASDAPVDPRVHFPAVPGDAARLLPESLLTSSLDYIGFVGHHSVTTFTEVAHDVVEALLVGTVAFLRNPGYVHSPHLRASFGTVLFDVFLPSVAKAADAQSRQREPESPRCNELFSSHPVSTAHMVPCLIGLYGDVEHTGFYDKLQHRYQIACMLNHLWNLPLHKPAFESISKDSERFLGFAHGLMNHSNHLLAESLGKLAEIRKVQLEMAAPSEGPALTEAAREERLKTLQENEQAVTNSLMLVNQTLPMLAALTDGIRVPFLCPELVGRLAGMLFTVMTRLSGKSSMELKVSDPEKYHFHPREMLAQVVKTVLNLSEHEEFVGAVVDSELVNDEKLEMLMGTFRRLSLLSEDRLAAFLAFTRRVHDVAQSRLEDLEALGEVPEEFTDPIMSTLMLDPVKLPSGRVMERSVIMQHLLNDHTDPFTRAPLSADLLVEATELKAEIGQWLAKKRAERAAALAS